MSSKDRFIGLATMAIYALIAYLPTIIGILLFQFIGVLSLFHAVTDSTMLLVRLYGFFCPFWAYGVIKAGAKSCTVTPEISRAQFERELWKAK